MPISNPCRPRVDWITRSQPQFQYNLAVRGAHMRITKPYRQLSGCLNLPQPQCSRPAILTTNARRCGTRRHSRRSLEAKICSGALDHDRAAVFHHGFNCKMDMETEELAGESRLAQSVFSFCPAHSMGRRTDNFTVDSSHLRKKGLTQMEQQDRGR
jgi:hypothetical protein